jgi:uncharacterized protein YlzI (FlbEa/FlbD family)
MIAYRVLNRGRNGTSSVGSIIVDTKDIEAIKSFGSHETILHLMSGRDIYVNHSIEDVVKMNNFIVKDFVVDEV